MTGNSKTRLVLMGLLAGSVALGVGYTHSPAVARTQDAPRQNPLDQERADPTADELQNETRQRHGELAPDEGMLDETGTGGAGDAGTPPGDAGTGGAGEAGTWDEDFTGEPGTGGIPDERGLDEDEGVLQPGQRDEGLDHQDEPLDTGGEGTRGRTEDF